MELKQNEQRAPSEPASSLLGSGDGGLSGSPTSSSSSSDGSTYSCTAHMVIELWLLFHLFQISTFYKNDTSAINENG
jgi:hypothetical protein